MKILPVGDGMGRARLRDVSKAVWGNKYRLEVALAVAESDGGRVYAHAICKEIPDLADNQAGKELVRLADAGLLTKEEPTEGQLRVYYERVDSCHWEHCVNFAREILDRDEGFGGPRLVRDRSA